MDAKIDTQDQILDAAFERFTHYGYSKTTMSEVARDCEMSAGNIYRFFPSKLDIAEAIAIKFNEEQFTHFKAIANKNASAVARFREFFFFALEETYKAIDEKAKILEIAEILRKERPHFFNQHLAIEREFLVKIIDDGIVNGEFRSLDNPNQTAEMMQSALMKFRFPQSYTQLKLDQLRIELEGVLKLLLAGLSPGATEPSM